MTLPSEAEANQAMTPSEIAREEIERQRNIYHYDEWNDRDLEQVAIRCMERYREHLSEMVCEGCGVTKAELMARGDAADVCGQHAHVGQSSDGEPELYGPCGSWATRLDFEQREKEGRG